MQALMILPHLTCPGVQLALLGKCPSKTFVPRNTKPLLLLLQGLYPEAWLSFTLKASRQRLGCSLLARHKPGKHQAL